MQNFNFAFFGTPDVASETLEILKSAGFVPKIIVTAPDRPAGRKMLLTPPPVKIWAIENNIPFVQPETSAEILSVLSSRGSHSSGEGHSDEKQEEFELFVVVAYGKILGESLIKKPKLGSINIHYSLLPKYRGASPVESSILNGDTETGVTIQQMEFKMDTGPVLAMIKTPIRPDEKAPELRTRLIQLGGDLLVKMLPEYTSGKITAVPQNEEEATYCGKIKKEDGLVDPNGDPVKNYNRFRAYAHWPRTFFFENGKRIIITDASLEDNKFVIKKVIPEGGKETVYWGKK